MNDEGKIKLNNQAAPKKDGLFIVVKRNQNGGCLTASTHPYQHHTKQEAIAEAERLAKLLPGTEFLVFKAGCVSIVEPLPVKTTLYKV